MKAYESLCIVFFFKFSLKIFPIYDIWNKIHFNHILINFSCALEGVTSNPFPDKGKMFLLLQNFPHASPHQYLLPPYLHGMGYHFPASITLYLLI